MAVKLFSLLAVTTLTLFSASFNVAPVNAASPHILPRSPNSHIFPARNHKRAGSHPAKRCAAQGGTATTTTTTAPAATPHLQKGGLAWGGDPNQIYDFCQNGIKWVYNWTPTPPQQALNCGMELLPQLWGWDYVDEFAAVTVQGYAKYALFLNEPNEPGQSNIDPWTACSMWWQYMEPLYYRGYTLIGAATSSNPNGLTWTENFMSCCQGCHIGGIAVHWYDTTIEKFETYVELWWNTFQLPIWVTEFACQNYNNDGGPQCSWDYIFEFMNAVTLWMNQQDYVMAYMPFGAMTSMPDGVNQDDCLMNWDGTMSSLAWTFAGNAAQS